MVLIGLLFVVLVVESVINDSFFKVIDMFLSFLNNVLNCCFK